MTNCATIAEALDSIRGPDALAELVAFMDSLRLVDGRKKPTPEEWERMAHMKIELMQKEVKR